MKRKIKQKVKLNTGQIIPLGFLGLILLGALLLMLPIASASRQVTDFSTALFTSTTSVCVTGSVVVDTYSYWSLFGKIVILCLIQLGGLGIVAVVSLVIVSARRRKSFVGIMLLKDSFNLDSMRGVAPFITRVFVGTLTVEGLGMFGYFFAFIPQFGVVRGIWYSFFTSVSAFCNAGIDIIGPDSLMKYHNRPLVLIVTMLLIILGGIGYVVWFDMGFTNKRLWKRSKVRGRGLSEHTKLVLKLTIFLIVLGGVLTMILEWNNPKTIGNMPVWEKIFNSFFQSVTYRTAGFTTFSQEGMHESTSIIGVLLMFVGGSPVGTAGGVKTVTMFVVIANVVVFIKGKYEIVAFGRSVSDELVRKATAIVAVHLMTALVLTIAMMIAENISFTDSVYEVMSGVCTVGVSRGLTPNLHLSGRIILIIAMYLGRIGPISMALFFKSENSGRNFKYANGRFIIG